MYLPDYRGGSIVNLMASIEKALKGRPKYKPLRLLGPEELSSKNIVLFVVDGLGYEYLMRNGKNTVFQKHLRGKMTSMFPSTTGTCIPTFLTGVAPQQHAIMGWTVFLKELGSTTHPLPFIYKGGGKLKEEHRELLFDQKNFYEKIDAKFFQIMPKKIVKSSSKKGKVTTYAFSSLNGMFTQARKAIKSSNRRKFMYVYWGEFDITAHDHGVNSKKTLRHFKELNKGLESFVKGLEGTGTTLIITADHGMIDTKRSEVVLLKNHPKLDECLVMPVCGDSRVVYCYVRPNKVKDFEKYVKTKLKRYCTLHKSVDLIRKNYFGLFKPNDRLRGRVGDYILIMKGNYIFMNELRKKDRRYFIGNHSGVSKDEMFVPLIVVKK